MEGIRIKTKLDRLESRLNAAGIATRRNYIRTENGSAPVLIADHDYTGPYPTRETWGQISTVDRVAARLGGGDPRLIILFILILPLMVIWETAKKS